MARDSRSFARSLQMAKTKRAKAIPYYVVLKWNKKNPLVPTQQKEWEIIKDYDIHYKWDSFLYTAERFQTYAQAKQFIYENK